MRFEDLPIPLQELYGRTYSLVYAAVYPGMSERTVERAGDAAQVAAWEAVRRAQLHSGHDAEVIRKAWEDAAKVAGEEVKAIAIDLGVRPVLIPDLANRLEEATRLRRP